jgi:hypothetical protein
MLTNAASRLVPFFQVLRSSLGNNRLAHFTRVFRNGLSAIVGQNGKNVSSGLALPMLASAGSSAEPPPLFQLASGYWISQAVYVAAKLGIADVLKDGAKSSSEIAFATGADDVSIARLMRALCAVGVFRANGKGKFTLTGLGKPLRSCVPGSLRSMVITLGEVHYAAWAHALESVKTGAAAFPHAFGAKMFDYLGRESEAGNTFNRAMSDYSALSACAVLLSYDFSGVRSIVDVGGGCGTLLTGVLQMYPSMQGTLFDTRSVIAAAQENLKTHACRDRCTLVSGSFLECIPCDADAYLLSSVLHDWDDECAIRILENCRRSMRTQSKVLAVEFVVPTGEEKSFSKLLDLNMLVMNGGRERTELEYRDLFDAAGLKLRRIIPTLSPLWVLEGTPKYPSPPSANRRSSAAKVCATRWTAWRSRRKI